MSPLAQAADGAAEGGAKKLWGGRFTGKTDPLMEKFNESLPFDKRMWAQDIRVRPDPPAPGRAELSGSTPFHEGSPGGEIGSICGHTAAVVLPSCGRSGEPRKGK